MLLLFSAATRLSYHSRLRLSTTFFNFFELFQEFVSRFYAATVIYYNSLFSACQALFLNFFTLFLSSERRRRDLNPRAAVNDLHPFQGCPFSLLGTSPCAVPINTLFDCKPLLADSFHSHAPQDCLLKSNGEGGIRTHAPFRTNGFQDRLVMTTSIPLRV